MYVSAIRAGRFRRFLVVSGKSIVGDAMFKWCLAAGPTTMFLYRWIRPLFFILDLISFAKDVSLGYRVTISNDSRRLRDQLNLHSICRHDGSSG
jgi:hypothetical protein